MKRHGVFHQLVFHFNWATKNREALLTPTVEARLIPYLASRCKEWKYELHAANGAENHFHVLVSLTPSMLIADVAKNLKGATSHYINKESGLNETLYWQDGYGVVSVRQKEIPAIAEYIRKQKEHHRIGTLVAELELCESEE
jgi:putative transposase